MITEKFVNDIAYLSYIAFFLLKNNNISLLFLISLINVVLVIFKVDNEMVWVVLISVIFIEE